jgi:hypothetical protein
VSILEKNLYQEAITWLKVRLPGNWQVEPSQRVSPSGDRIDGALTLQGAGPSGVMTTLILEIKSRIEPRDAAQLVSGMARIMRDLSNYEILVVSPWLSPRTREVLTENGLNYLDLTGNSRIQIDNPTVFIETNGSPKDPNPLPKGRVRLQGPKAGRLIRTLCDFAPPYGVVDLANATGLAQSYVSRVLDELNDEALIDRPPRSDVLSVNVPALIRRWATTYDVLKNNARMSLLAPTGPQIALSAFQESQSRYAVTGSFAAYRVSPIAVPSLLMVYVDEPEAFAKTVEWLPTSQGANVMLLKPFDSVVWENTTTEKDLVYVAMSQAVADCLTGTGRMPSEGEALLNWMSTSPDVSWKRELKRIKSK